MYNGIGLETARGSGTNGHVQRNLSFVRLGKKDNEKYKTEADINRADAINNRQPNEEILEHERKRKMEVKILEFEEILEDQSYTAEEIAAKVQAFREKLTNERKEDLPKDEFGRYSVRETHQIAAAKQEKNAMLRSAFGISEYFVEGSSFDADRKAKEELTKSVALQKELDAQRTTSGEKGKRYRLLRSPSPPERSTKTDKSSSKDHKKNDKDNNKDKNNGKEKDKGTNKSKEKKHSKDDERPKKDKKQKSKRDSSIDSSNNSSSSDEEKNKKSKRKRKYSNSSDSSSSSSSSSDSSSSSSSSSTTSESSDSEREKSKRSRKRNHSRSQSDNDRKHRRK